MIDSIEITRFRGIREGKLEGLTPLTVLVGPNGCGKSTVLDAMLIGGTREPSEAVIEVVERHRDVEQGPRWLFWKGEHRNPAEITLTASNECVRECQLKRIQETREKKSDIRISCNAELQTPSGALSQKSAIEFPQFSPASFHTDGYGIFPEELPPVKLVEARGNGRQVPLHQLYSETRKVGRREETRALITDVVPGSKDIEILTEGDKPIVYLIYKDGAVPAALSGDGIHALVRVTLELAACSDGVVLFEEPEVHQHPGAIRQSIRAILAAVRRNIQVVLTTHSLELIDALLAESSDEDLERLSLYRLELEDGQLISVRQPGSEVAFSRCEIEKDLR